MSETTTTTPYAKDFDDCWHEDNDFDRDAMQGDCAECGAHADEYEVEEDEDGKYLVPRWMAPADEDPRAPWNQPEIEETA
jgi:hypothetical protein